VTTEGVAPAPDRRPLLDFGPVPGGPAATAAETHISVVFFAGRTALKVLKPVDLGFIDLTSRQGRRHQCERELAMNRRFAPDVYLGVVDLTDAAGSPQEHGIVMRWLPADRRLSELLASPEGHEQLRTVARTIAAFHGKAARNPTAAASASWENVAQLWQDNAARMAALPAGTFEAERLDELEELWRAYMDGRRDLFDRRIADGHAVDGHGDLLADDIFCMDDGPRVLDCLAFDDRLRCGDVLYDIGFLVMDVERLSGADLAARLLADYVEFSGERHPASLADFYVGYRAQVRALVSGIRGTQGDTEAAALASAFLEQACTRLRAAVPRLVLVGGTPGTGKSTLAEGLSQRLGWSVLGTDELRKDLVGVTHASDQSAPPEQGIYQASTTEATYGELLARAARLLAMGESVVLDGSWVDEGHRRRARQVAADGTARLVELRCELPATVALQRLRTRRNAGPGPSDATPEVLAHMRARMAEWPEAHVVDTTPPSDEVLDALMVHLATDGVTPR